MLGPVGKLLSDEKRWTKGSYARDDKGEPVGLNGAGAVCWCVLGAIYSVHRDVRMMIDLGLQVADVAGVESAREFNDSPTTTHADLMAVLEKTGI